VSDAGQLFTGKTRALFFARMRGLVLAMTVRIILIFAVAIMIGPSLAFGSPACMTESEALAKFPKANASLYAPKLLERQCSCARAFATTPTTRRSARAVRTTGTRGSPRNR
jgi:hypothetical protein